MRNDTLDYIQKKLHEKFYENRFVLNVKII